MKFSREIGPLGTGGAIKHALSQFECSVAVIQNGDTFLDFDYEDMLSSHIRSGAEVTVGVRRNDSGGSVGGILIDDRGDFCSFEVQAGQDCPFMNAGIYIMNTDFLARCFPDLCAFSLEKEILSQLDNRDGVALYRIESPFYDMGTPAGYKRLSEFLSSRTLKS